MYLSTYLLTYLPIDAAVCFEYVFISQIPLLVCRSADPIASEDSEAIALYYTRKVVLCESDPLF